jgi:redox-sensitive bicupin YhaK (pirin superfamily)
MGSANYGWLKPRYHFSFASYYNPSRVRVGTLRVLNDDMIEPHGGFDTHPHDNMEIVTYVINGKLTHKDSMGNERKVGRGDVQYMSAGTGVTHSEYNNEDEVLRLLQIWVFPDQKGLKPNYGDMSFDKEQRHNKLLHIVSDQNKGGKINIHQDVNFFVSELDSGKELTFEIEDYQALYLVNIEGTTNINGRELQFGDALKTDENITITSVEDSHFLLLQIK